MAGFSRVLRLGFVGAGAVNFGGSGPWDHASRLEKIPLLEVVAIADVDTEKAKRALETRKRGARGDMYEHCQIYATSAEMLEKEQLDAVFIGIPPNCHGSLVRGLDIDLACVSAGIHTFIEKPVSVTPPEIFKGYAESMKAEQARTGAIVAVGYMFRYHEAVEKIRSYLAGRTVMSYRASYNCAYSHSDHPFWWNKKSSGGPIIEQATHLFDLARYLCGEPNIGTIAALAVEASEPAGRLSRIPPVVEDDKIGNEYRIDRATTAHWKFHKHGLGSLLHAVSLHGKEYEASVEIWCDGMRLALIEPYRPSCQLKVRTADADSEQIFTFENTDPYFEEVKAFIEAIRTGNTNCT